MNLFGIKKLYSFTLERFFPLLAATFSVCLFIFLMQFLWVYISDMVGKGVNVGVLGELFFYAALTLTSMALPISLLFASLMTFGSLGEHLELLAMKASGISLIRIMRPLIITVVCIALASFYFQNSIVPKAQVKMLTIISSLRDKSPELNIPEGIFCKEIPGYNVYVKHKDQKTGFLYDMMIYDYSKGFENARIIVADTGKLDMSEDKKNLVLSLYSGESFQNLETRKTRSVKENVRYSRETFTLRTILIQHDSNFNMADESIMGSRDIGKSITELTTFIDSVRYDMDSISAAGAPYFKNRIYVNTFKQTYSGRQNAVPKNDTLFAKGVQAYFAGLSIEKQIDYANKAKAKCENVKSEYLFSAGNQAAMSKTLKGHEVQFHKRFSLSLACILFFFIGAPLGAIIRKGGLGLPSVLSVFLFILYYTIDIFGQKMARQGIWPVWEGMWFSSLPLAALGIFFTYKAVGDSVVMNPDAWKIFFQRLTGKRETRHYTKKEVIMNPPDYRDNLKKIEEWNVLAENYRIKHKHIPFYTAFWMKKDDDEFNLLVSSMDAYIESLLNSEENLIINKLMDYPVMKPVVPEFLDKSGLRRTFAIVFPVGLILYLLCFFRQKRVNNDLKTVYKVNDELKKELENSMSK